MACGENPKRVYGNKGQTPMTRMGTGWLLRQSFYNAAVRQTVHCHLIAESDFQKLKQEQEQWNCLNGQEHTASPPPANLALEGLVAILNHQARLMVHCYKVEGKYSVYIDV
jgi:hypothetical protein